MESKINNPKLTYWIKGALFVLTIIIIVQLYPDEEKFKYYYQNGKPWKHELLTAPFDFLIYKEDEQLKAERDSVLKSVSNYYKLDENIEKEQILRLNSYHPSQPDSAGLVSYRYKKYIEEELSRAYNKGIISLEDIEIQNKENKTQISVIKGNNVVNTVNISDILTIKSAYNHILSNCPRSLDLQELKSYNIENYLKENLLFDEKTTAQVKQEAVKNISLTSGVVLTGERIIDHGEIISDKTYQILNSLKKETESRVSTGSKYNLSLLGEFLLVTSLMIMLFLYLILFRPLFFANLSKVIFILMMILLMVLVSSLTLRYTKLSIYIVPFALLPIIVRTFFDSRTALHVHIITVLLVAFMVANPFEFMLLQIVVGMITVSSLKDLTQRSQLIQTAAIVAAAYSLIYFSYSLFTDGNIYRINVSAFAYFIVNGLLLLFAYGLIYIFEKMFGFLSNVTLVELSNVNSPLMTKFSEDAPGTFQHSLQVASLATEAAAKTNANSLLVRVGALYHDIGKMNNPMYFIENQGGRVNPLSQLEYDEAAKIIINHVPDGVKIAQKHNLPKPIIDFIQTHHAQSKAKYFYNSFKNKYPDVDVDERIFTYPGPKPFSREMAILMMADAVEAASRTLPEYTEEAIENLVENIIDAQIAEGSFKNAPITFQHIERIKTVFKQKLKNIYHSRINYPELREKREE